MTATVVGGGTSDNKNNAAVTTTYNVGTADGDTVVAHVTIRSSGTGVPVLPAGWTQLALFGNELVCARTWHTGDATSQVFTFTGGAAGDDCTVQSGTYRGVRLTQTQVFSSQLNGSAQDIAYPAMAAPLQAGSLVMIFGWKQNGAASAVSTPAGFTAVSSVFSALGSGATATWKFQIQSTPAAVTLGTMTVTGGVAAISRAVIVALSPVQVNTITQNVWPARVLVSVASIAIGDTVSIYRVVGSDRFLVQGGATIATDVSVLRIDAQQPFGVPVGYVAVVNNLEYPAGPATYTLDGGKVALSDAITGLAAEVVIWAWDQKTRGRLATLFKPGGRNVVVSGPIGQFESELEIYLDAISSVENVRDLIAGATQGIIQIRQAGPYADVDCLISVMATVERRYSQDGSDEKRIIRLSVVEVDGWAPTLLATGFTYAQLAATYVGLTYADVAVTYSTYLLLAQGDFS